MAVAEPTAVFSGNNNQGFQLGKNAGSVSVSFNHYEQEKSPIRPFSAIPFRRDPDFISRGDILDRVEEGIAPSARVALVGLGGVGKSQLAVEFSYRFRQKSPDTWVFWVHAGSTSRFEADYKVIADRVEIPGREQPDVDVLQLVYNWLSDVRKGRWIMIVDNADDASVLFNQNARQTTNSGCATLRDVATRPPSALLPQSDNGAILITSRNENVAYRLVGNHRAIMKVYTMTDADALELLRKKLGEQLFQEGPAVELARALDHFPLALTQASAYICQRAPRSSISKFITEFRKSEKGKTSLLDYDSGDLRRDESAANSVIRTWEMSFERIRAQRPSAAGLLSMMSFLDRQGIPDFLFQHAGGEDNATDRNNGEQDTIDGKLATCSITGDIPDEQANNVADSASDMDAEFEEDVLLLRAYSMISTNLGGESFEMHRLVQLATRRWLAAQDTQETWKRQCIKRMHRVFPFDPYGASPIPPKLFPHVEALESQRPVDQAPLEQWAALLNSSGSYAVAKGSQLTGLRMIQKALTVRQTVLGPRHVSTFQSRNNLAMGLRMQGKYEQAEQVQQQLLEDAEEALGTDNGDVVRFLNNLVIVLGKQGKYEREEQTSVAALKASEEVLGNEHPTTLASVSNLATALYHQGKDEQAEPLFRRAIKGSEKAVGKEHSDTLTNMNNLAAVLSKQGKHEEAEQLLRQVLELKGKLLGKENPETLITANNLASIINRQRRWTEAEEILVELIEMQDRVMGKSHPSTTRSRHNLAYNWKGQGRNDEAIGLMKSVVEIREETGNLPVYHPDTQRSIQYLDAWLLESQKAQRDACTWQAESRLS